VFTARYALSPYIKQIRFVFKGLNTCLLEYSHVASDGRGLKCESHKLTCSAEMNCISVNVFIYISHENNAICDSDLACYIASCL
jgi:hypothetical protein